MCKFQPIEDREVGRMRIGVREMPRDDTANVYLTLRDNYKPLTTDDAVWELVWRNFAGYVGETMASLQESLAAVATSMSLAGHRSAEAEKFIRYLLLISDGHLTADQVIDVRDVTTQPSKLLLNLEITRSYSSLLTKRRSRGPFGYGWTVPLL